MRLFRDLVCISWKFFMRFHILPAPGFDVKFSFLIHKYGLTPVELVSIIWLSHIHGRYAGIPSRIGVDAETNGRLGHRWR